MIACRLEFQLLLQFAWELPPKGLCVKGWGASLSCYWEMEEPWGDWLGLRRKLGHCAYSFERVIYTCSILGHHKVGSFGPHSLVTRTFCLAIGPKTETPNNDELKPLRPWGELNIFFFQVASLMDFVTVTGSRDRSCPMHKLAAKQDRVVERTETLHALY